MALRLFDSLKPVIAAVNGAAAGGGATMQTAMDIRLAATTAKFVFPFARRGIVPEAASTWFLPKLVGLPTALEWCFTGRQVSALEARDRGLVRSLHEPEDLMPAAREIAREIVENTSPVSVALIRRMFWRLAVPIDRGHECRRHGDLRAESIHATYVQKTTLELEGPWQSENVFGDVGKDQVRRYGRNLIESGLAEYSFYVVFACKAEAAVELETHVGSLPRGIRCEEFRHVSL